MVSDRTTGEYGAETPNGQKLVPKGKHFIIFHESNGGYFELRSNGLVAAYSTEGKELIPFSNGYDRIVKQKEYFSVRKNDLEGACDLKGNEIIKPQYSNLFYSSVDGFNTQKDGKYVPLGIEKGDDDYFSGVDYSSITKYTVSTAASNSYSTLPAVNSSDNKQTLNFSGTTDKDQYRRSSLCLILLTHRDKKYAAEMERVFREFPLPARYNEHNISDLRVISVRGKQSKSDIDHLVRSNYVAQKVVGRWFNRSYSGRMNMDLIHERGGYGAFYADYQRSKGNVRGTDMLRDEGIELLQSTFVLV